MERSFDMTPAQRRAIRKYRQKPEVRERIRARSRARYARRKHELKLKRCVGAAA